MSSHTLRLCDKKVRQKLNKCTKICVNEGHDIKHDKITKLKWPDVP